MEKCIEFGYGCHFSEITLVCQLLYLKRSKWLLNEAIYIFSENKFQNISALVSFLY